MQLWAHTQLDAKPTDMIKEILFELPHIKVVILEDGFYALAVDDFEVNDYVEDFLIEECDIDICVVSTENIGEHTFHYSYFENNLIPTDLISSLKKLDLDEIEKIYKLNNIDPTTPIT